MARLRVSFLLSCCAVMAGCAGTGGSTLSEASPGLMQQRNISPQDAGNAIAIGKSTKADVLAALGKATVVPFDSGYEIWVYRWKGAQPTPRAATEFVVLFDPAGLVKKARIRPGYESAD